jgi:hypothetical protein
MGVKHASKNWAQHGISDHKPTQFRTKRVVVLCHTRRDRGSDEGNFWRISRVVGDLKELNNEKWSWY